MYYYFNKLVVCLLLLLTQTITYSQEDNYIPILNTDNVWTNIVVGTGQGEELISSNLEKYKLIGDTTINNVVYQKMYVVYSQTEFIDEIAEYVFAIREDEPQLYIVPKNDLTEYLYLDFSVNEGDVLTIHTGYELTDVEINSVTEDDEGRINVSLFRRSCYGANVQIRWIEGIGSESGIVENLVYCQYFDGAIQILLCLENDTTVLYQRGISCNAAYTFYPLLFLQWA